MSPLEIRQMQAGSWQIYGARIHHKPSGELVIDTESPLEKWLTFAAIIAIFLGLILLTTYFLIKDSPTAIPMSWPIALFLTTGLLFFCRKSLKDVLIVDFKKRSLVFQRTIFGQKGIDPICSLDEIQLLIVSAEYNRDKWRDWWTYGLSLLCTNGRLIELLPLREVPHDRVVADGQQLATLLGLELHEGSPEMMPKIIADGKAVQVIYGNHYFSRPIILVFAMLCLIFTALVVVPFTQLGWP